MKMFLPWRRSHPIFNQYWSKFILIYHHIISKGCFRLAPLFNDWQILCARACTVHNITSKDASIYSANFKSAIWIPWLKSLQVMVHLHIFPIFLFLAKISKWTSTEVDHARMYLQLPLHQWGAGNVYLLVLSSWKVNIAENLIIITGL